MPDNKYPISNDKQLEIWDEAWDDAKARGNEYAYTLAMTQSLFSYRIGILSDRILDHDMLDLDEDIPLLDKDEE